VWRPSMGTGSSRTASIFGDLVAILVAREAQCRSTGRSTCYQLAYPIRSTDREKGWEYIVIDV
jgi:hypothetical protein